MKQLDNAIRNYWFSRGFNKAPDTGGWYQMELDAFSEGWREALEWALTTQGRFDWRFCPMISPSIIEKELNAKT